MKKGTLYLLFSIVLLGGSIAFGSGVFMGDRTDHSVPAPRTSEQLILITLEVEGIVYELSVKPGSSVYDAMVQAQETSGLSFGGSEFSGLGFFLEEINGLRQNPRKGKYWIYYINGLKAKVGISMYELKIYDVISWKYEDEE